MKKQKSAKGPRNFFDDVVRVAQRLIQQLKLSVEEAVKRAMTRIRKGLSHRERKLFAEAVALEQVAEAIAKAVGISPSPAMIKVDPRRR